MHGAAPPARVASMMRVSHCEARRSFHSAKAICSTRACSVWVCGARSILHSNRKRSKSSLSSPARTGEAEDRLWRVALRATVCLPSEERGPVERRAFARLAANCASESGAGTIVGVIEFSFRVADDAGDGGPGGGCLALTRFESKTRLEESEGVDFRKVLKELKK